MKNRIVIAEMVEYPLFSYLQDISQSRNKRLKSAYFFPLDDGDAAKRDNKIGQIILLAVQIFNKTKQIMFSELIN